MTTGTHRPGATIDNPADESHEEEPGDAKYNDCTIFSVDGSIASQRGKTTWINPNQRSSKNDLLFSGNLHGRQQLIWRNCKNSLNCLHGELKALPSEICVLWNDISHETALSSDQTSTFDEQEVNDMPAKYRRVLSEQDAIS